ncbi:unnamed protein product [Sympodiomycopsis kandeliae]
MWRHSSVLVAIFSSLNCIRFTTISRRRKMSFKAPYRYITATSLAELLKQSSARKNIAVIDVRDDDFSGGNIVGCKNIPSTIFESKLDSLVKEMQNVPTIVFHCSLSQQRGPKSARMYSEHRSDFLHRGLIAALTTSKEHHNLPQYKETGDESDSIAGQKVLVLRDGFSNFGRVYQSDKDLVEGYDQEAWMYR